MKNDFLIEFFYNFCIIFFIFQYGKKEEKKFPIQRKNIEKMVKIKNMVKDKLREKFTTFFYEFILNIRRSVKSVSKSGTTFPLGWKSMVRI